MLNQEEFDPFVDVSNPLDSIEDIMMGRDWTFDRPTEDELTVQVTGQFSSYNMEFIWQDDVNALRFVSKMDTAIHPSKMVEAYKAVNKINTALWLGHFYLDEDENSGEIIPHFRHTSLFRGMTEGSGAPYLEDLILVGMAECERYFLTFDLLSKTMSQDNADLNLAMMDVAGLS